MARYRLIRKTGNEVVGKNRTQRVVTSIKDDQTQFWARVERCKISESKKKLSQI